MAGGLSGFIGWPANVLFSFYYFRVIIVRKTGMFFGQVGLSISYIVQLFIAPHLNHRFFRLAFPDFPLLDLERDFVWLVSANRAAIAETVEQPLN